MPNSKDRHLQKSGHQSDLKGKPKKGGAGKGNWGSDLDVEITTARAELQAEKSESNE